MEPKYSLEIYKGGKGLSQIFPKWISILETHHKFFQCPRFYKAVLDNLEFENKEFYFFLILDRNIPIAVLPFLYGSQTIQKIKTKILELPNHSHFNNTDFILHKVADIKSVTDFFIAELHNKKLEFDALFLKDYTEGSIVEKLTVKSELKRLSFQNENYHTLRLDSYEKILNNLSTNFRRNIRRLKNKIARDGFYEFRSSTEGLPIFQEFLEVEAISWKGKKGTAIKQHDNLKNFYLSLLENDCEHYCVEVIILKHKNNTVAGLILIESSDTIYLTKIAYNDQYRSVSPGHLLIDHVLEKYSENEKYKNLNFYSSAQWIEVWNPSSQKIYLDLLFNDTVKGKLIYSLLKLTNKLK